MEEITTTSTGVTTPNTTTKQPRPFVLALLLTGVLYFGVKPTLPTESSVLESGLTRTTTTVSTPVADAVLQDLSVRSGLPKSDLQIVQAKALTWQDVCLGLSHSSNVCKETPVPGWRVKVTNGSLHWFYRTDSSGSLVKLEKDITSPSQKIGEDAIAMNFRF
jgi:hypothetical protein